MNKVLHLIVVINDKENSLPVSFKMTEMSKSGLDVTPENV